MVNLQLDDYCREFMDTLARRGIRYRQVNWAAYRRHRLVDAERAVRTGYLLQALGNAEDIQVSDEEVDQEIRNLAERAKLTESFETVKASIQNRGALAEIRGRVRTDKIFDMLLKSASITTEMLDQKAYDELLEMEHRREEGIAQARFDAGGLEGGNFEEQTGGEPEAVVPASQPFSAEAIYTPDEGKAAENDDPEEKPAEGTAQKRGRKKVAVESEFEETAPKDDSQIETAPPKRSTKKADPAPEPEEVEEKPKRGRPKKADVAPEPEAIEE
jgi:trigger factor